MADLSLFARNSVALQADMFRVAKRDYGLSTTVLSRSTGISKSTLDGWASGQTAMPAWAIGELALPADLASFVLDPYNRHVGDNDVTDGGIHDAATDASEFNVAYIAARDPRGPGGEAITPQERAQLAGIQRRFASRKVAA